MELTGKKIRVLDTETTGCDRDTDELLQVSVLDGDGNVVYDSLIRPHFHAEWPDAERISHITPEMAASAPYIENVADDIRQALDADVLVTYNGAFDEAFLLHAGIVIPESVERCDAMKEFRDQYCHEWGSRKYKSLNFAAKRLGYDWGTTQEHRSDADCLATLYVWKKLNNL